MSEFKIDGPGFYRQRDGGKAEVFCERNGRWYGMSDRCDGMSWNEDGTRYSLLTEYDIVARWPRFAVGDRVRVKPDTRCVSEEQGKYGIVLATRDDDFPVQVELETGDVDWWNESALVQDDRPDPGPEHRLLGDDEILEAGDERQDGCDREPRRWLGPLTKCDVCIGKTVREVNAEFPALRILAWRRRLLNPAEPEQEKVDPGDGWRLLERHEKLQSGDEFFSSDGQWRPWFFGHYGKTEDEAIEPIDGTYRGTRRRVQEQEQWVPTCEDHYVDLGLLRGDRQNGTMSMWFDGDWHLIRHERKWQCGDKVEWRPIPVEVTE